MLKYKPVPYDTEEFGEPNCVVLSCDPITDCFVTQGDGVQIFADSKAVLESLGKASTKSISAIPTPTLSESSKEKETEEASGKASPPRPTPQLSTLQGREDSMLGTGILNANDTAPLDKKENNVSSNNTTPVQTPNMTGGQDGLTTNSNKGDTPEKAPSTGPVEAPLEETSASSKVLTAEGVSNAEHTAVYNENETSPPVSNKGERVASPADGRTMMSTNGSTPVNSTETAEALGNSSKSTADAMPEALSAAPDNVTTIFHQTLPSPISKSFPITQYPHNASKQHPNTANTASNATTPTISASRTAQNINAPPSKNTASDATTKSKRLNDSTPAFPHNSLTPGPQSHQSSPAPLQAEGGAHNMALPVDQSTHNNVLPIVTESSTSEADGQTNTSSAVGDVDRTGSGGWTPAHNDSVGLAAGSRLKGAWLLLFLCIGCVDHTLLHKHLRYSSQFKSLKQW